jgi:hypothetical protein
MDDKSEKREVVSVKRNALASSSIDLVLEKNIFSSVFDKDIRRAYMYKKSERIGKALHLILPAFKDSKALKDRAERISVALVDASLLPPSEGKEFIARELLALSSIIAMAKASGRLSSMNAGIILREAEHLLTEIASYEAPHVMLEEAPTLASLARTYSRTEVTKGQSFTKSIETNVLDIGKRTEQVKSKENKAVSSNSSSRTEQITSLLRSRGSVYIKDLSTMIRDVSEKTIQRELQKLVLEGKVKKEGERRWTRYTLV